jgi:hypothetical protein
VTTLHHRTVDRPSIVRFVQELETAYAKEWPERSARWIIEQILMIRPDTDTLTDAALRIERGNKWLPSPSDVVTSVSAAHREAVRYDQPQLPTGAVENAVAPFLENLHPGEAISWDQDIAKLHAALPWCDKTKHDDFGRGHSACHSSTCDSHRTNEQITDHEQQRRKDTP